ncbi:hypothetical protein GQ53DRAFT_103868 [Thozetella sp. PMI_491]|nr:hypothetical protein GQ53DRAFT_103868 [Thozetella sp. PMI_491]
MEERKGVDKPTRPWLKSLAHALRPPKQLDEYTKCPSMNMLWRGRAVPRCSLFSFCGPCGFLHRPIAQPRHDHRPSAAREQGGGVGRCAGHGCVPGEPEASWRPTKVALVSLPCAKRRLSQAHGGDGQEDHLSDGPISAHFGVLPATEVADQWRQIDVDYARRDLNPMVNRISGRFSRFEVEARGSERDLETADLQGSRLLVARRWSHPGHRANGVEAPPLFSIRFMFQIESLPRRQAHFRFGIKACHLPSPHDPYSHRLGCSAQRGPTADDVPYVRAGLSVCRAPPCSDWEAARTRCTSSPFPDTAA